MNKLFHQAVRKTFHGVEVPFDAAKRHVNPIFYVSSSAWNLYDLFEEFMEVRGFPQGPILLRDLGIDSSKLLKSGHDHKLEKIREIMSYYPTLSFVLIGDSGQQDAWLYRDVAREFPGRVAAIYLHDVRASHRDDVQAIARELDSEGIAMHLIEDASAAAQYAAAEGLICKEDIAKVDAHNEELFP